ncbi:telomeric repeat-binding factor 1 isoform X1 [Amblyraja radiata]|uniref:telomeric repeat-binding factor 1 isoform X1 n=1 Tax=Amblyraja radiata TaxID=386614 RepID=UPI0014027C36|nr:telomeric repeat-binding factor 1 isoform X1 [Amblyraja radiata]
MESCSRRKTLNSSPNHLPLTIPFGQVLDVASGWILDFMCYCLCRYFGSNMFEEFRVMRDVMNGFVQQPSIIDSTQEKKVHICQILSRIVEGNNLDVQFDKDENITPLESALMILIEMVDNNELPEDACTDLKQLLQVQSVAVCMKKGNFKKAAEVLERQFQENTTSETDQSLRRKLSLIITKKDPYHKFLNNFNNKRLLESAESLANKILSEINSNFLLQAAHKVVESKKKGNANMDNSGDGNSHEHQQDTCEDLLRGVDGDLNNTECNAKRSKKRLYNCSIHKVWTPGKSGANKDNLWGKKLSSGKEKRVTTSGHQMKIKREKMSINSQAPRKKRPWMWEEDTHLKEGVRKYGSGNWSKILEHYDFNNRTSVMLKDRWRTMKRLCIVHSDEES